MSSSDKNNNENQKGDPSDLSRNNAIADMNVGIEQDDKKDIKRQDVKNEKHCLSFGILDDLRFVIFDDGTQNPEGPLHITFEGPITLEKLRKLFRDNKIDEQLKLNDNVESVCDNMDGIIYDLSNKGWWCANRVNKYYVVAFAIDGVRFDIYSKDCNKELINWGKLCPFPDGKIVYRITDSDYNESPVIKLMRELHAGNYPTNCLGNADIQKNPQEK
jgi:hypothetical protein